jgi:putative transposase
LGEAVEETGVRLYLYCLMANHVHLVVETPGANLSAFMHKLETGYTVYFNLRHRRVGHLTQGRYHAKPVQGTDYLLKLTRYVHLNPVHVGALRAAPLEERQRRLREYVWSSYRGYAGLAKPQEFVSEGSGAGAAGG